MPSSGRGSGFGGESLLYRATDDEGEDFVVTDGGGREGAPYFAVAQHRDPVGDPTDLGQAVGYVDDAGSPLTQGVDL